MLGVVYLHTAASLGAGPIWQNTDSWLWGEVNGVLEEHPRHSGITNHETMTVGRKGALSTSPWRPAHTLGSFVPCLPRSDFRRNTDPIEEALL